MDSTRHAPAPPPSTVPVAVSVGEHGVVAPHANTVSVAADATREVAAGAGEPAEARGASRLVGTVEEGEERVVKRRKTQDTAVLLRIVELAAEQLPVAAIARELSMPRTSVSTILARHRARGQDGFLKRRPNVGRKPKISDAAANAMARFLQLDRRRTINEATTVFIQHLGGRPLDPSTVGKRIRCRVGLIAEDFIVLPDEAEMNGEGALVLRKTFCTAAPAIEPDLRRAIYLSRHEFAENQGITRGKWILPSADLPVFKTTDEQSHTGHIFLAVVPDHGVLCHAIHGLGAAGGDVTPNDRRAYAEFLASVRQAFVDAKLSDGEAHHRFVVNSVPDTGEVLDMFLAEDATRALHWQSFALPQSSPMLSPATFTMSRWVAAALAEMQFTENATNLRNLLERTVGRMTREQTTQDFDRAKSFWETAARGAPIAVDDVLGRDVPPEVAAMRIFHPRAENEPPESAIVYGTAVTTQPAGGRASSGSTTQP